MFDIREYYNCSGVSKQGFDGEILDIDTDLASDIDMLISDKKSSLYITDRYKTRDFSIDIIYPELGYPGSQSLIMTPDRLRFLISFYPYKGDLEKVEKIVLRPRYIEAGNVELAALYLKRKKTLVLYLTHPGGQSEERSGNDRFISVSLEHLMSSKIIEDSVDRKNSSGTGKIPLLWNILAVITPDGEGESDKFFIKRDTISNREYIALNDISYFYYRHGY